MRQAVDQPSAPPETTSCRRPSGARPTALSGRRTADPRGRRPLRPIPRIAGPATTLLGPLTVRDGAARAAELEELSHRAAVYATRARGDGTRRAYRSAWRQDEAWCVSSAAIRSPAIRTPSPCTSSAAPTRGPRGMPYQRPEAETLGTDLLGPLAGPNGRLHRNGRAKGLAGAWSEQ